MSEAILNNSGDRILHNDDKEIDDTRQGRAEPQVNALYLRGLRDYLQARQMCVADFLQEFGLAESLFDAARERIPVDLYERLLIKAGRVAGDPDIGLHVGEYIRPGHFGALGFAVMACRTAAEVYRRHERYEQLVASIGRSRYQRRGDEIHLTWDTGDQLLHRAVFDETLSSWVTFARWLVNQRDHSALRISFPYPRPQDVSNHERIFCCELTFSAPHATLVFPAAFMDLPLTQSDPAFSQLMAQRADEELKLLGGGDWIALVRSQIKDLLTEGEVSLSQVALRLKLSERALQRRLQEQSLSYQQLLEDTRKRLATDYVRNDRLSLSEVAFLLGFADQSAFNRAFRQWTGETPGRWRKQLNAASNAGGA